ncbi:MAG TPA: alpha/beta hydrolase [Luteitalea sp.]|nr:alpha/beta hydrolase [Luteitalea sp.]
MTESVHHRYVDVDGVSIFYREAGPRDAPVVLLPHGYPCSSYEFRALMPRLADRWRLVAPDFPGCGYSATPDDFTYTFDGYAAFLDRFRDCLGIGPHALYLHDFGSQIGLRLAIARPDRITALIVQNGDIYEDVLGPRYAPLQAYWANPTPAGYDALAEGVSKAEFAREFLNDVDADMATRIPPDLWELHWALMTPQRKAIAAALIAGLRENRDWFPRYQSYLRTHRPPTLIAWGPRDGFMPEASARAYLRDLPAAELRLFPDGGHWLLETHLADVAALMRDFLLRVEHAS